MVVAVADRTRVWLIDVAFFSYAIATKESMRRLQNQIFHSLRPLPGAPKMSGFKNDTYGITGNPYYGWRGAGLCKERV